MNGKETALAILKAYLAAAKRNAAKYKYAASDIEAEILDKLEGYAIPTDQFLSSLSKETYSDSRISETTKILVETVISLERARISLLSRKDFDISTFLLSVIGGIKEYTIHFGNDELMSIIDQHGLHIRKGKLFSEGPKKKRMDKLSQEILSSYNSLKEKKHKEPTAKEVFSSLENRIGQGVIHSVDEVEGIEWTNAKGKLKETSFRSFCNRLTKIKKDSMTENTPS